MPKENGSSQGESSAASSSSLLSAATARFIRQSSSRRESGALSGSASKYRIVTDAPAVAEETPALVVTTATGIPTSPVGTHGSKPPAKHPPLLKRQATEKGSKSPVRFADLVRQASKLKIDREPDPGLTVSRSPIQHSKLPQKIRSSVSRMRSHLSLLSGNGNSINNNTATSPDAKPRHRSIGPHSPTATSSAVTTSPSSRPRYSRQSQEMSAKQVEKTMDRRASSMTAYRKMTQAQRSRSSLDADSATVLQFMELLRPLQSSMNSLRNDGEDSIPSDSDDEDDEEADALFRQHEREGSRILRICCSLDNLLFSIADEVQEHKHDVIAVASGPARKLVELIFTGINQIADAMIATQAEDGMPSLTAKDERYLREFLVEIADRWSALDELLRGVFVSTLERTRQELAELQAAHSQLKEQKQVLELEMLELREFHSSENAASIAVASNFMRLADHKQSKRKGPETDEDERLEEYDLKEREDKADGKKQTADEEIESLKAQCSEYGRLLEMAKQEIRLTHQERQSQHARLVELSQSLLRDEEVAQLRNELQAEKKRVKILELEGLRMRESQMDLNLKIQSLQINQSGPGGTTKPANRSANTHDLPLNGSGDSRQDATSSASADSQQHQADEAINKPTLSTPGSCLNDAQSLVPSSMGASQLHSSMLSHSSPSSVSWLSRVLEANVKSAGVTTAEEDDGLIRLFLTNLLMTEREIEAATAQAKLRKKSNVPTLGAPPRPSASAAASPTKKKKKKNTNGVQDPNLVAVSMDEWVSDSVVIASVRQLIWVFYELYLMAEETRRVLNPQQVKWHRDSASVRCPPPLSSYVLHYFLERHPQEEGALSNLHRFITVLTKLRGEYGDVRLFCEFLNGSRGREELHFHLWALQAIDTVDLGVRYDDSTPVTLPPDSRHGRYVCTLKALYLTRIVYRLLHAKSLRKPTPASPPKPTNGNTKLAPVAAVTVPAASPSKKRRKSRPVSAGAISTGPTPVSLMALSGESDPSEKMAQESIIDRAKNAYTSAFEANSGYPLTLEAFNALVLTFAVSPSEQELLDRLGTFYRPTGDERKISLDVFLVLLSEAFATQMQWRRAQLQALFVRLAKEEEVERLLAAKKLQDELEAEAALAAAAAAKKTRGEQSEKPKKKVRKRERRVGIDKSPDRHLKGLSRERLRKFLIQGGLVSDDSGILQRDFDALYVAILEVTREAPSEVHFDQLYDTLSRFEMVGNELFAVDSTAWLADDAIAGPKQVEPEEAGNRSRGQQVVDTWRVLCTKTLTVTENDPNIFIRHIARELIRRANTAFANFAEGFTSQMETVNAVQDALRFAWSVASRRIRSPDGNCSRLFESCLSEFFYLNQAVKMMITSDSHYASNADLTLTRTLPVCGIDDDDQLSVFYDCRFVRLDGSQEHLLAVKDAREDLQRVLQRYALHIAHLFESYSLARFTDVNETGDLTRDQWLAMANDIGLLIEPVVSVSTLEELFVSSSTLSIEGVGQAAVAAHTAHFHNPEVVVDKPQFVALLVHTAVMRYQASVHSSHSAGVKRKRQGALPTAAQVVDKFCQFVVVPHAFHHRNRLQQEDFQRRLGCPLVGRVLLEHRAFLRQLFFHFAKCEDGEQGRTAEPAPGATTLAMNVFDNSRRVKTTRNSMTLSQFINFLEEYRLYEMPNSVARKLELRLDEAGAQHIFRASMAIESDDFGRMEFDEFTTAVSAIAVLRTPHPFVKLHVKIDTFVVELRTTQASKRDHRRQQQRLER